MQAVTGRGPDEVTLNAGFDLLRLASSFISVQTLLPALLLVIVGEVARIRGSLYYVVGGGAALAAGAADVPPQSAADSARSLARGVAGAGHCRLRRRLRLLAARGPQRLMAAAHSKTPLSIRGKRR